MALINCPECNREVSDKAKACFHCGYPFTDGTEKIKFSSALKRNIQRCLNNKIFIIITLSFLLIIIVAFIIFSYLNSQKSSDLRNTYIDNLESIALLMEIGSELAEDLSYLTARVWYNTIFKEYHSDTWEYTKSQYSKRSPDFNVSLAYLYSDPSTITKIELIKSNQNAVQDLMNELRNPDKEFENCYSTLQELYRAYSSLTRLAIEPTGNLTSYQTNRNTAINSFGIHHRLLKAQIPKIN